MSLGNLAMDAADAPLRTRLHCDAWEEFVLAAGGGSDAEVTIQAHNLGFVSPATLDVGARFVTRAHVAAWETFTLHVRTAPCGLTRCVAFETTSHAWLGLDSDGLCVASEVPVWWGMWLTRTPVVSVAPLYITVAQHVGPLSPWPRSESLPAEIPRALASALRSRGVDVAGDARVLRCMERIVSVEMMPPEVRCLSLQLVRAMMDVGAFLVRDHDVNTGLLRELAGFLGPQPRQEDAEDVTDGRKKRNIELGVVSRGERRVRWPRDGRVLDGAAAVAAAAEQDAALGAYFDDVQRLAEALLHTLALGQQLVLGEPPAWRWQFSDHRKLVGLRLLAYHPGPLRRSDGSCVVTTHRHTDATWLTVLNGGAKQGLHVIRPMDGRALAVPCAEDLLLVNTGNVMQQHCMCPAASIRRLRLFRDDADGDADGEAVGEEGSAGAASAPGSSGGASAAAGVASDALAPLFRAVCHYVLRTEETETETRFSLPLFYDRAGGGTGGC